VETLQLSPPVIRDTIVQARVVVEGVSPQLHPQLVLGAEAAEVMGSLTEDIDLAIGVLVRPVISHDSVGPEVLGSLVGRPATEIALSLSRLGELGLPRDWSAARGLDARQAETLRKMLLAVVSDPRLVLARLAEKLVELRHARETSAEERERRAVEARAIFAPLANRLGVWQLKWELEDLAFRYLEPEEYRQIAAELNERRADRERYIDALCETLRAELTKAGIQAQVYGRPKHIYSIYRKMAHKHLAFEQLFDVRAVRVIVASIPDCYAALGVVHSLWPYIQGEFDDYIATPKDNFYRSIHTAVMGPQGKSVEVQIRTSEMHEHAELGVAAHWTYKEGGARDTQYQRKIEWVRRLLEPHEASTGDGSDSERDFLERVRTELFEDRVYALTPKGEVIDLPRGATPLDFAYSVHTSLGHRCRGAKVNGRIVPLTYTLTNGEIVEIITSKQESPGRDWMAPEQGYLVSARNRSKVRAWFRKQDVGDNRAAGRVLAERELARVGFKSEQFSALVQELASHDADHLYQLLGEGEITVTQLLQAATRLTGSHLSGTVRHHPPIARPGPASTHRRSSGKRGAASPVDIEGVGDLPVTLARCCAPLRPQSIAGYVTIGRGVTIHRTDCPGLIRMRETKPERVLNVEWSRADGDNPSVELSISAYDRRGLVRDVTDVLAYERLSIEALTTTTDRGTGTAHLLVTVHVVDLEQLTRLLKRLTAVPNVIHARRLR
jgi:GTP pyrophosphokinase